MGRFDGKVALVTGASRGIGRGIALQLATEGADVVVNFRTHPDEAREVADLITGMGRRALVWQADVADRAAMEAMFAGAVDHFGRLDVAVANAASSVRQPVEADWPTIQRTIEVSQFGVFHACQLAAQPRWWRKPHGRNRGKIVVISSVRGVARTPQRGLQHGQDAINHLTATLAAELTAYHINVNVISRLDQGTCRTEIANFTEGAVQAGAARACLGAIRHGRKHRPHRSPSWPATRPTSSPAPPCASTAGMCWGCGFRSKKNRNED
ncbi:MAG: SDR family NAD(P)-dependent oxidoreductase [Caldilineaceae bacterium]